MTDKKTNNSTAKSSKKTQGQLLEELYIWSGLSQEVFTNKFGKSATWFKKNREVSKLFRKAIPPICRAFNIPPEYFEGTYQLPDKLIVAQEKAASYGQIESMEKEIAQLKELIIQRDKKLLEVMEKYQILLEKQNS